MLHRTVTFPMTLSDLWRSFRWPTYCCYFMCAAEDESISLRQRVTDLDRALSRRGRSTRPRAGRLGRIWMRQQNQLCQLP